MSWNDNGVRQVHRLLDQSAAVSVGVSIGARMSTRAFNQVGFLRRARIRAPITGGLLTITSGQPVTVQAGKENPAYKTLAALDITAQGIAPIYQLGRPDWDLMLLEYMGNGVRPDATRVPTVAAVPQAATYSTTSRSGRTSVGSDGYLNAATADGGSTTNQNVGIGFDLELPITEWVRFPASATRDAQGNVVAVSDQLHEIGLVTLQNTQQNVTPHLTLNPLVTATAGGLAPFIKGTTLPSAGTVAPTVEIWTEFYDVPSDPANSPPPFSQAFIITRQSTDVTVTGGRVVYPFSPAGMLMRAAYMFTDTNGAAVDVSAITKQSLSTYALPAQGTDGTINFLWGSRVTKHSETFGANLAAAVELYGDQPPVGVLFHDFFTEDHSVTDLVNTALLTSVRTEITGLPAAVTAMHVLEERMVPVRRA